jgi:methylphosphotriester-DNA--protein-cysteine methyltransferase
MTALTPINWPSARHFTEALQYPSVSFTNSYLRDTLPAVDKLGMPLVTSGQFAYVYKLNRPDGGSWAVRCFRSYLADRQERYAAYDAHFRENFLGALPRFAYEPEGLFIGNRRYPILVMEWLSAPTLDSYVGKVLDKPDVLQHLADEWVRLMAELRAAGVAHGDLQHGNILVQNGGFRLVDLDGMYVPALRGWRACEVGHQHFQHPRRAESWFHEGLDNFSALSIYLSLIALAKRPSLWGEHHDENLLFTKQDFQQPDKSALWPRVSELSDEHKRLARLLSEACRQKQPDVPALDELVEVKEATALPAWMNAPEGVNVTTRTREAARPPAPAPTRAVARPWYAGGEILPADVAHIPVTVTPTGQTAATVNSGSVQTLFGNLQQRDPDDVWNNTVYYAAQGVKGVFSKIGAFWIIFLFSSVWIRLITGFWAMFGVDALGAFVLTLLLGALGFLIYGFLCALELANNSSAASPAPLLAGSGTVAPPQPVFAPNAAPAALPPAQASNIPWYRQQTTPPVASRPLPPGARRAPDWVLAAQPQSAPQNQPLAAIVAHYAHYHQPDCPEIAMIPAAELALFNAPVAAQQAGYQACSSCAPYAWPLAPPAVAPVAPAQPAPVMPPPVLAQPAPAPAKPLTPPQPVVANRDSGLYHRPDCEDAVIIPQEDEVKFDSPQVAEMAGFHRCMTCKPKAPGASASVLQPVIGSEETKIFHRPDCEWAGYIKQGQRAAFNNPAAAVAKGYYGCTTCKPDTANP